MRTATTDQPPGTAGYSRRTVLRAGGLTALAATPLAGCGLFDQGPAGGPDPLAPLATAAQELALRYEAAIAADADLADRLTPVAQAHRTHAAELARLARVNLPAPSGSAPAPPQGDVKAVLADLRAAEQAGRKAAAQACLAAPGDRAALLGSIAAARTTHLEVLR